MSQARQGERSLSRCRRSVLTTRYSDIITLTPLSPACHAALLNSPPAIPTEVPMRRIGLAVVLALRT